MWCLHTSVSFDERKSSLVNLSRMISDTRSSLFDNDSISRVVYRSSFHHKWIWILFKEVIFTWGFVRYSSFLMLVFTSYFSLSFASLRSRVRPIQCMLLFSFFFSFLVRFVRSFLSADSSSPLSLAYYHFLASLTFLHIQWQFLHLREYNPNGVSSKSLSTFR